jgi:hypothetical protein
MNQEKLDKTTSTLLDAAWAINIQGILQTLQNACKKLFINAEVLMSAAELQHLCCIVACIQCCVHLTMFQQCLQAMQMLR